MSEGWGRVYAEMMGLEFNPIPVLTFSGTWAPPGVGYPSDVVNGADDSLVYEVPVQAPWSFGPMPPGAIDAPSYDQSVAIAVKWASDWLRDYRGDFILGGYSQGAEAASKVLQAYQADEFPNARLRGGYTCGNPMRQAGKVAAGWTDPGGHGIAPTQLTDTPATWFDYANPGDMYANSAETKKPAPAVYDDMADVYLMATGLQLNDFGGFVKAMVQSMLELVKDLGGLKGMLATGILGLGVEAVIGIIGGLTSADMSKATGVTAAADAAMIGLKFLAAGTGPHITYQETGAIDQAIAHVNRIAA